MRRRRFLAAVAASLSLAGCGSRGPPSGDGPGTSTPTDDDPGGTDSENPTETTDPTGTDPLDGRGTGETTSDVNPHGLTIRNDGKDTLTVELRITNAGTDETLLDQSYTLGSEEEISSELQGPATYHVRVAVPEAETEHVTTVDDFDTCNSYGTIVTIDPDGTITSETISIRCDGPAPAPDETPPPDGFALGETTGDVNPHGLTIRNDGEDTRTVELRITDADTDETLLNRSYTLEDEEAVRGTLRGPATYHVRVSVPETGTEHATTVDYFDTCNSYGTTVRLHPDGTISSETISTLIACEEPTATPDESD